MIAVLRHEGQRIGNLDILVHADVSQLHALDEMAGTDAHEGDPVAVGGVHICLYFEHKTGQRGSHYSATSRPTLFPGSRRRGVFYK